MRSTLNRVERRCVSGIYPRKVALARAQAPNTLPWETLWTVL